MIAADRFPPRTGRVPAEEGRCWLTNSKNQSQGHRFGVTPQNWGQSPIRSKTCWTRQVSQPELGSDPNSATATRSLVRAKRCAGTLPALEAGLSSTAAGGSRAGACLSEASLRQTPPDASSVRHRAAARTSARLFFGYFHLTKQKKVARPPGRTPASGSSRPKSPQLATKAD